MIVNSGLDYRRSSIKLWIILLFVSASSFIFTIQSIGQPGYGLLSLLPLSFILLLFIDRHLFDEIPGNMGLTFLFLLEFARLVITPIFMVLGGYPEPISLNSQVNTPLAILLIVYETLWISLTLRLKMKIRISECEDLENKSSSQKMLGCLLVLMSITIISCVIAPEILRSYRNIAGVFTDSTYTSIANEQSFIVNRYATNTIKKLFLVLANYLIKIDILFIPLYLMTRFYRKQSNSNKLVVLAFVFMPLLFVGGAIGRSIIYVFLLFIIYYHMYSLDIKKLYKPIILAFVVVVIYFYARYQLNARNTSVFEYYSYKLITYFQGANIVAGSFNLPTDIFTRFHYFIGDILRSVPFANTIFGLNSSDTIQNFFNGCNNTAGFIPTTIGQGYYYFSAILAPLYSSIFAWLSLKYGRMMNMVENPFYKLIYLYVSIAAAMGVTMYSIEITLGTFVAVIFPIYIMSSISYKKLKR